ncbi:MAG: replication-associated recombination protein A [Eubacteriales bacterium]
MIPLSTKMRPDTLEEFIGQNHFMYKDSLFYNSIKNKTFESAIFFGPSGVGKTSLARIIAKEMDADFYELNASTSGIKELKEIIDKAKLKFFGLQKAKTYLYIDEFHRWNKLQQDSLLKALEDGVLRFIGSTTENPYFSINNAILSRVRSIYEFKRLTKENIIEILKKTISDKDKGIGSQNLSIDSKSIELISELSNGDARIALDTLGFISDNIPNGTLVNEETISEAMQRQTYFYDKSEDRYNLLSALQKSIRGSDQDASIHYLARLVEGGADIVMIGRRLLVIASEDVGLAYPNAISIVTSCVQAAQMVGLPEARIILSEAVLLLALCPKSNSSIVAIDSALSDIRKRIIDDVPDHLKDASYSGASKLGIGKTYKYPHSFGGYVEQQYLPNNLYKEQVKYYKSSNNGKESALSKFNEGIKKK